MHCRWHYFSFFYLLKINHVKPSNDSIRPPCIGSSVRIKFLSAVSMIEVYGRIIKVLAIIKLPLLQSK